MRATASITRAFSYGDGYNALGYYQFDRRWSLVPFMKQVYNYDSVKYGMLKAAIDRGSEISNVNNPMYANGQLTELGRIAQEAFQGAYNADPAEFSALQDAYAYNSYYAVTEAWLKSALGIDISGRADCVKGMVWSITNMCGTGGCQDFFRWANLSNSMTDREFVTALSNSVVNNVATKYASQPSTTRAGRTATAMSSRIASSISPRTRLPRQRLWSPSQRRHLHRRLIRMTTLVTMPTMTGWMRPRPILTAMALLVALPTTVLPRAAPILTAPAAGDSSSNSAGNTDGAASGSTDAGSSDSSTGSSDSSADTGSSNDSNSDAATDSGASKDDSNKAPDAPATSTDKKPSFVVQLGCTFGSSLMAGVSSSSPDKNNSDQASTTQTAVARDESKEKDESKGKTDDGKQQGEDGGKDNADNQNQEQNGSKTVTTTTTTTTTKSSGGNMPKTGDLIVMASLASASLATLGATSIVSGKHKLDQQNKTAGEDGSEE